MRKYEDSYRHKGLRKKLIDLLREKGITVPWNDVLIASMAVKHGCRVYSLDKHFAAIAATGIVRLYQPGYSGMFAPE